MKKKGTFFIIPGFRQRATNKTYKEISNFLKKEGFTPVIVPVEWSKNSIQENAEHFVNVYSKSRSRRKYVLGFSYGAMIALIASSKIQIEGLVLCSLSPYFKNDLKHNSRKTEYVHLDSSKLAKKTKAKKILMLYGKNEAKDLVKRVSETFIDLKLQNKYLIPVESAEHNIGHKEYLFSIHASTRVLF